jgi:arylsulfatase A-like enzyme
LLKSWAHDIHDVADTAWEGTRVYFAAVPDLDDGLDGLMQGLEPTREARDAWTAPRISPLCMP